MAPRAQMAPEVPELTADMHVSTLHSATAPPQLVESTHASRRERQNAIGGQIARDPVRRGGQQLRTEEYAGQRIDVVAQNFEERMLPHCFKFQSVGWQIAVHQAAVAERHRLEAPPDGAHVLPLHVQTSASTGTPPLLVVQAHRDGGAAVAGPVRHVDGEPHDAMGIRFIVEVHRHPVRTGPEKFRRIGRAPFLCVKKKTKRPRSSSGSAMMMFCFSWSIFLQTGFVANE